MPGGFWKDSLMAEENDIVDPEGVTPQEPVDETAGLRSALEKERADRKAFEKDAKRAKALEAELARLRESTQTEAEKAIAKAREEAAAQAR